MNSPEIFYRRHFSFCAAFEQGCIAGCIGRKRGPAARIAHDQGRAEHLASGQASELRCPEENRSLKAKPPGSNRYPKWCQKSIHNLCG
jgi:hypothetical protein